MASRVDGDEKAGERRVRPDRGRVLIAEDDRELRALVALALEGDGYEVLQVEDGRGLSETLELQCWIDVIISDVRMPHGGGLGALAEFRRRNWSTPFILVTAFGSEDLHEEARRLGVTAVVDKPFEMDDLMDLVRRLTAAPEQESTDPAVFHDDAPRPDSDL
jgi:DNA-binding NtrC family response regulator